MRQRLVSKDIIGAESHEGGKKEEKSKEIVKSEERYTRTTFQSILTPNSVNTHSQTAPKYQIRY